jgi:uncharacterized protein YbjT (DUF2867 family)
MAIVLSTVLVTGASGFVGSHVLPELLGSGHRIVALVHSSAAGQPVLQRLPPEVRGDVELRPGDVDDPASLSLALAGIDAVVHLVAIARDRSGGRDLARINTDGTRHVIEAMSAAGVRRLVHLGALGVVDDPTLHYASSKARAEALVAASGLDWTILKPSLMWGTRDGFFNIVADLVRVSPGIVPVPGNGRSRFQPLAVADLARTVRLSLADPATIGRAFELGGPRYWTYREITAEVASAMGRRRAIMPMPLPLIRAVATACEAIGIPFPVATDQLRQLKLDNIGPLDGFNEAFGFAPLDMAGNLGYLRRTTRYQEPTAA